MEKVKVQDPEISVPNVNGEGERLVVTSIQNRICTLRGEQVILDRDLAELYKVEVKQMNRQVKRNIERFPEDFMFQLTKEEYDSLKCQIGTSNTRGGDRRAQPHAFTEQGVAMLSGILRSEDAVKANILIMRAFVAMRQYLSTHVRFIHRLDRLELTQLQTRKWMEETDEKIDLILDKMEERSPQLLPEQIFRTGCVEKNHDRFLIIDDKVYLMGASLKDMGAGLCAVTEMQASSDAILSLLK